MIRMFLAISVALAVATPALAGGDADFLYPLRRFNDGPPGGTYRENQENYRPYRNDSGQREYHGRDNAPMSQYNDY